MSKLKYLKEFDKSQLWRFFVDGRFHKKYDGWVGYEAGERGSIQALLNGFSFMIDNFDLSGGLKATYLRELHKVCMLSVETTNLKSSPGDIRYLNSGMPFFSKTTTHEHLVEVFAMRSGDGTSIFNSQKWGKPADELNVDEIYQVMLKDKKINYRNWYPNLDKSQIDALEGKKTLHQFYEAKHSIQMMFVSKMEDIVNRYNTNIKTAITDDEKLKVITLVSRELELLHPFPDGNSRTFSCIMSNHLLMYNGFLPSIVENPNYDNELSHGQWTNEVKKGMNRSKQLLENHNMKMFNYSILDMDIKNKDKFLDMASELISKIDNYKEIFLTPTKLTQYTKGKWIDGVNENIRFTGVGTYGTYSKGNIYFAMSIKDWIKDKRDIASELKKVLSKGIRAVVLDDMQYIPLIDVPILYVKDCFDAFKQCSIHVRQEHNPFTVLITGTEGKTGSKVQFHHILNGQAKTHAVLNSANTEVPVLRSLINLESDDKVEINEVSVGSDEAYRVERTMMVNPNLCFFTNIGPNHMDMHKTLENIMIAKSSVVEGLVEGGKCILNSTIEHYDMLLKAIDDRRKNIPILTYGYDKTNTAYLISQVISSDKFGWDVEAFIDGEIVKYFLPLFQNHAPLTSVGILLTVKEMGYDVQKASKDYEGLIPFETMGRILKIKKQDKLINFYDQSRRGGIHGMRSAFNDMKNFNIKGKVIALVGGISTKKDSDWTKESHKELASMINESRIDRLYTTGNFMDYVTNDLKNKDIFVKHSDDLDKLANGLYSELQEDDLLFIIGSAYLYLGRVSDKIMKLKYTTKFDSSISDYKLSAKNMKQYKSLIVFDEVEKGNFLESSLVKNNLSQKDYSLTIKHHDSFTTLRRSLLMQFFKSMDEIILKNNLFRNVNDDVIENGSGSFTYNEEYCSSWFNNLDKKESLKSKQLFGSFYYFGDNEYLLHIEVATIHFHIGFVKYEMTNSKFSPKRMDDEDRKQVSKRYANRLKDIIELKQRTWGLRWYSCDCGELIDLTKAKNYTTMVNFKDSKFNKEILLPTLKEIVK